MKYLYLFKDVQIFVYFFEIFKYNININVNMTIEKCSQIILTFFLTMLVFVSFINNELNE